MDEQSPLRIHQDENFTVNGFSGKQLEQLIGFEYIDQPGKPIIVFIKAEDNGWQQFFLDAGMGFWGHTDIMDEDNEAGFVYMDYAKQFNIQHKIIHRIYCEKIHLKSQIVIVMDNKSKSFYVPKMLMFLIQLRNWLKFKQNQLNHYGTIYCRKPSHYTQRHTGI